ncbi:MAG: hypothetical protein Q7R47_00670, partial [Candidatus Diapherotrites archaeon]|nr:hypothetical protein [Candidatus Diapherotrites archaeon]
RSSFSELNTLPTRRGMILDVFHQSDTVKSMVFSPSVATPLVMHVKQSLSLKPFAALYSLRIGDATQDVGDQALLWTGAGTCTDFDESDVSQKWQNAPDRRGRFSDRAQNANAFYGVDWQKAEQDQSMYLKTIVFLQPNHLMDLHAETPNVSFATSSNAESPGARLNGISTMTFNRSGNTASDSVTAIDDLFELVEQKKVCVTNTGVRTSFWWNPDALYDQTGSIGKSITQIESGFSGNACK